MTAGGSDLVLAIVATVVLALVLVGWLTRRAVDPTEDRSWAAAYGVTLTDRNRSFVRYYVRLSITLRVIGGVGGLVLGYLFDRATGMDTTTGLGFWAWILGFWVVGAAWAERQMDPPGPRPAAASLTPRRLADYLPVGLRSGPLVAMLAVVAVAMAGVVAPTPTQPDGFAIPSDAWLATGAAIALAAFVGVTLLLRSIVGRRQPVAHHDLVAADDAVRASTLHHVAAGGTAALLAIGGVIAQAVVAPRHLPFGLRGWVPMLFGLGTLLSSRYYAYRTWRVRRPIAGPDASTGAPVGAPS